MNDPILDLAPLGFPWETADPFLFCVHHNDAYPVGNEQMGPDSSLAGRSLGSDFSGRDGWSMYHGRVVPGFPQHPHRGFETITVARRGFIDHSDSLGAAARFGEGDVQWMTAGAGVVHSEMFPLRNRDGENPVELFQIWLNLPAASKMAAPHFSMFWRNQVPVSTTADSAGRETEVTIIAGKLGGAIPLSPPPHSWASQPGSDVAIWSIRMQPGARWTLPAGPKGVNRTVYAFAGTPVTLGGRTLAPRNRARLRPDATVELIAGQGGAELLVLQGRPIGEPVVQYGPFVMNSRAEIAQTIADYQRTGFGGWPWPSDAPVHGREVGRFARHADGRTEIADARAEG